MAEGTNLGQIERTARRGSRLAVLRLLLPLGWALAAIGYYGPWIDHANAALTLGGGDLAEFVKFLPGVVAGTLQIARHVFYLPPVAVLAGIALLSGSERLAYPWPLRLVTLTLAVLLSLQLLPPAWSPASLSTPEFHLQAISLVLCWLALAGSQFLGRLPGWFSGLLTASLALAAAVLPVWEFIPAKPAIDGVYGTAPPMGWGFFLCVAGLAILTFVGVMLTLQARQGDAGWWAGR